MASVIGESGRGGSSVRDLLAVFDIYGANVCPMSAQGVVGKPYRSVVVDAECEIECITNKLNGECNCGDLDERGCQCGCGGDGKMRLVRFSNEHAAGCPCHVFEQHDCIPRIVRVGETSMRIKTYLENRDAIPAIIRELDARSDHVVLRELATVEPRETPDLVHFDLANLTEKQRTCLAVAVANGYFESPRRITLSELATELDLSPSVVSRRLRTVQTHLFGEMASALDPDVGG